MKMSFLDQADETTLVDAIRQAEKKTTGEIRVCIQHRKFLFFKDEMQFARRAFNKMGMTQTPDRNGVLIVIFPKRRKIVILGDEGVHQKFGQAFWEDTVERAIQHFKKEEYVQGIVRAVEIVGKSLKEHFPKTKTDSDSLPNKVVEN